MVHRGVEFVLEHAAPDGWKWQFRVGNKVLAGKTQAKLQQLAIRRVQQRIDKELRERDSLVLSPRERQLLRHLAAGKTDAEIAAHYRSTTEQISHQRGRLLKKLGITAPAEIADAADRLAHSTTYKGVT